MRSAERVRLAPAFVLHQRNWRESSRIVEIFSHDHGRLGLVARGIRRPSSPLRALLVPFRPLLLSWNLRGELGTLIQAEPGASVVPGLHGRHLMAGFYLNELILSLVTRHDPHPELHDYYAEALTAIGSERLEDGLRLFELRLLDALGYGLSLEQDAISGEPVLTENQYLYDLERGPLRAGSAAAGGLIVQGATLKALAAGEFTDVVQLREARTLLRAALEVQLGGRTLKTREVLRRLLQAARV